MKKVSIALLCIATAFTSTNCATKSSSNAPVTTKEQKISYMIGRDMGTYLKQLDFAVDKAALMRGIEDTLNGKASLFSKAEMDSLKQAFQTEMQEKQMAKQKSEGEKNLKAGQEFLEKNKSQKGVIVLPSGLQYQIISEGTGPKPAATDRVTVHYTGTTIDGKEFDSSVKRGQPATFPLNGVIPGWTEGLQQLKQGTKAKLFIPANLAYGERGAGPDIGPNSTLIFEVELISIEKDNAAAQQAPAPESKPSPDTKAAPKTEKKK